MEQWGRQRPPSACFTTATVNCYSSRPARTQKTQYGFSGSAEAPQIKNRDDLLDSERGNKLMIHYLREQEARRLAQSYPNEGRRVMPTRLGNVLRHFEETVGKTYGLDILQVAPHLTMVAPPEQVAYVRDAREEMDAAIGLCVASLLATLMSVGLLLTDRAWMLASLLPYSLAYVAYRGAVAAAAEYGSALSVMVDLGRFALYENLRLVMPTGLVQEREKNVDLTSLLDSQKPDKPDHDVPYHHPAEEVETPSLERWARLRHWLRG